MNQDLIRIIDGICREKGIEREDFLADLEIAMATAIRKARGTEEVQVRIDPRTCEISASAEGVPVEIQELGRIAAQAAKQVITQKTRERERLSIFEEFTERVGQIMTGTVVRNESGNLLVSLGRAEGFLPRSEQIPGETHNIGERIRVLILEVREQGSQVKIILSRSHPDFIKRLFELEVPEVAEHIIEIRALAREAGYRTKVAVASIDSRVDAVGACVGVRGSRIKNIVQELGGEKIDIVRWNESSQILIQNALKPAEVQEIALCLELGKATVVVTEDQLSLAIGKRGQNVRLAARLTGWDIDILKPDEYAANLEIMEKTLKKVEGVDDVLLDKIVALGCVSVQDVDDIGPEPLVEYLEISPELAERICVEAGEEVIRQEEEKEAAEKARREAEAAGLATDQPSAQTVGEPAAGVFEPTTPTPPEATPTPSNSTTTRPVEDQPVGETSAAEGGSSRPADAAPAPTETPQGIAHRDPDDAVQTSEDVQAVEPAPAESPGDAEATAAAAGPQPAGQPQASPPADVSEASAPQADTPRPAQQSSTDAGGLG